LGIQTAHGTLLPSGPVSWRLCGVTVENRNGERYLGALCIEVTESEMDFEKTK
jgi:hypothetical protein